MNESAMTYKGHTGSMELDGDVHYGKILNIAEIIMYESETQCKLYKEFSAAVDEYILDLEKDDE